MKKPGPRRRPQSELISCNAIARHLGRSAQGVADAIERLQLEPELNVPAGRYYPKTVIPTIEGAMRAPNKAAEPDRAEA